MVMKQHITKQQLNELDIKQKSRTPLSWTDDNSIFDVSKITIGELIEFLGDDLATVSIINKKWLVYTQKMVFDNQVIREKELVDALWEATKSKLQDNG